MPPVAVFAVIVLFMIIGELSRQPIRDLHVLLTGDRVVRIVAKGSAYAAAAAVERAVS
jgi:hypothetical protein